MIKLLTKSLLLILLNLSSAQAQPQCAVEKFTQFQMQYCLYPGKGPLLVLQNPLGSDMSIWPKSFIQNLNQFSEVLVYNRLGYGASHYLAHKIDQSTTANVVSAQLNDLLKQLSINKPIVMVGHSIGGLYAQDFVRNYPKNIEALVLIDSSSPLEPQINSPFVSKIIPQKGTTTYFESIGYNQSMDQVNDSPKMPQIPLLVITATEHGGPQTIENQWQELQRKLTETSPKGIQVIAQGSGHFVYQDNPNLVVKSIHDLIQEK